MKQAIESIQKPHAKFSLINTGSKPKYTVRTTLASVDGGGVQSAGQALSLRDNTTSSAILPMISRGFWLLLELESRYKGLPVSRLHGCNLNTPSLASGFRHSLPERRCM